ncbi:MAG TPA: carboxypeptidase-like regulatory domain-containing protein [Gemmatimonadaceae bacterium]|jgi:hypothetical protein
MKRFALLFAAVVSLLFASAHVALAQADVIRGQVTSAAGGNEPIANAQVTATTLSGGVNRNAKTDKDGRYTITFPGGEGDYIISVIAIGYAPRRFEVKRTADQAILLGDARMTKSATLDTVVSLGKRNRPVPSDSVADVGGTTQTINDGLVPIEQVGDLAAMASSLPGVLLVQGVDGDPSGFSVLGLDQAQNGLSLNGMNSTATDIPRDADVSVTVSTSPYDVSQGQFSGGRQNVTLSHGSNYVSRKSSMLLNAPQLQWTDAAGRALGQQYSNVDVSGGLSGPIKLDEAFYNISYELGRNGRDVQTLLNTSSLGLQTSGVSADSVARLLGILRGAQIPPTVGGFPGQRVTDQGRVLGSVDFAPPSSSSGQALNLTFNGSWNRASPATSALLTSLPASSFYSTRWDGAVQLHHTGYFSVGILSETGIAVSKSRQFVTPYLDLPSGNVLVNSSFANGTSGVQDLDFGGTSVSSSGDRISTDLTNHLSWFSLDNKHRIDLTSEVRRDGFTADQASNQLGTFAFNSLADLDAGRAASFTRQLNSTATNSSELIGGLSLGDSYRRTNDLQIVYGARLDANRFLDQPELNAAVQDQFGVRNDHLPDALYVSPRVGFAWTYGTASQVGAFNGAARIPRAVVRGGIGVFQNSFNVALPGQAMSINGLPSGVQQLNCTGAATPVPAWGTYGSDPGSIPTQCADGTAGTVFASTSPNVTLFDPNYASQRSVRSNLQWAGAVLGNRFMGGVNGVYSRNMNQPGFVDLNLDPTAKFTLPGEGNRPVFVQASSIVPATGSIASRDGRVSTQYNHVTELRSDLSSDSKQVIFQLSPLGNNTTYTWGLFYALNSVRDEANGFTSTAGNPFDVTSGRAAMDWRHEIQFDVGYNLLDRVRLFWVESFFSGFPFTPTVSGDVNGDGYGLNDRAFIFNPSSVRATDTTLASSMQSLLASSPKSVRSCLERQLGQLAGRNSCEGPWTSAASLRIDFNPVKVRLPQRTLLSLSIGNPLGGADLLLHGENHSHGWGQNAVPDSRLLFVRGFDPVAHSYVYQVNQRFGKVSQTVTPTRNPVTLTARVQVDLGPSRERQDLTKTLDRGRTQSGTKATASQLKAVYGTGGIVNPMATILRASDTLKLTGPQADSIATINRWYLIRLDSIWSPVTKEYAALGDRYDHGLAYDHYKHAREASVDLLIKLAPSIDGLLTKTQKRKLPSLVTSYLDRVYLTGIRAGTSGAAGAVFPTGVGLPSTGGQAGARSGGGGHR